MRRIFDLGPRCAEGACTDRVATAAFCPFSGDSDSFRVTPFRGGAISQNPAVSLSLAMSSRVPVRRIFDLGPRCAEGACADRVATAAFRQTRACARARRARARIIFIYFN